ncbi:MAG: NAD(P)/FAD-dependent oxidoreductase [Sphingomonadaceae bacterium]|nr:NAD(P)/FAD-dependent oxidoreductase [Sphingomonadaceae bacterium]NBU77557.1 NAD(P)/FAD-dependent oxidoreductase [Sphingomonadaceae bacterium]NCA01420.1 NAD(P)/FAD-dependent oxidoreductase [Sphingomonadaceae bacterium]
MTSSPYDAIILGAGGAGLMCAATAGQLGQRVLVIDHANEPGKKILISGGGRCNFTNVQAQADRYLSANPHFAKSALGRYRPADFIALVDRYGIAWHEKTLGQLFCDGSAKQIVAMLMDECARGGVDFAFSTSIGEITHHDGLFGVAGHQARALVIATGGPSIPKMGATGIAYDIARRFGLKVVEPRPALVPLTLGGSDVLFRDLSGVSADVEVRTGKTRFREAALFTHKGLSGPAILQISSYWRHGEAIDIDFAPHAPTDWLCQIKREKPKATLKGAVSMQLPDRLSAALVERVSGDDTNWGLIPLADMKDALLRQVEAQLGCWSFHPNGTEGYAKAEVTAGGISTAELSQRSLMANKVPGLYAIGEAVDVTGWLGGYNFQWAWASGVAAGQAIAGL